MNDLTPPTTPLDAPATPAPPSAPDAWDTPFDLDTLPPHLRAALDRLSEIRYDAMVLIAQAEREAEREALQP